MTPIPTHILSRSQNEDRRFPWRRLVVGAAVLAAVAAPAAAKTSHAGWPPDQHLLMDKGPAGEAHVLRGLANEHNYLLGGDGNDTIYGGNNGDVIWGDYRPSGQPTTQTDTIHAGNGKNFIYTSHGTNNVWTGTSPLTMVTAHYGQGTVHCGSPKQLVNTTHHSGYRFIGCGHLVR